MSTPDDLSIAVFGSVARREADAVSDRDILVVSDDHVRQATVRRHLERGGWSCTSYCWGRLEAQVLSGSLFAHHLRLEARYLRDPGGRLQTTLSTTCDRASYEDVFQASKDLMLSLQAIPRSPSGRLWAADILMVSFRGMAVARLAEAGNYTFSIRDLARRLERSSVARGILPLLFRIRHLKACHRMGSGGPSPGWSEIFELIERVDRVFGIGMHARSVGFARVLEFGLNREKSLGWYGWSRHLEASMQLVDPRLSSPDVVAAAHDILTTLRAPTDYGWLLSTAPDDLVLRAREVLDRARLIRSPVGHVA